MMAMKKLISIVLLILFFISCREDDLMFHELNAISMRIPRYDPSLLFRGDTVTYSFAFENVAVTEKTIKIPIELAGLLHRMIGITVSLWNWERMS